ncbi:MAG: nitrous oxide-stimulated promoter family protein [Desulfobacteraceae bacterium]|nr:nitrous oxide-stimulated promoter family protein [Desulfobacteraceae bacterium]MBU4054501.1 nitrous oxide-stimulated promoter family protein [Pseudomonadota bacterium]
MPDTSRMQRERKTVQAMIRMCCKEHHSPEADLCPNCMNLSTYADRRLDSCPFGERKTNCTQCPIHCYTPEMRERIRLVMRYSGPKMIWRHPILAIRHLVDGLRKIPLAKKRRRKSAA